jgi:hypothetical protein
MQSVLECANNQPNNLTNAKSTKKPTQSAKGKLVFIAKRK